MERKAHFYITLVLSLPLLRSLEVFIYQLSRGMTLAFYWVPQIAFSLVIGILLAASSVWLDKARTRSLWLLPSLAFVYSAMIAVLNGMQSRVFLRGGIKLVAEITAIDGLLWAIVAFIAALLALKLAPATTGFSTSTQGE